MHYLTNSYIPFSKTNSTNPRHCVPLVKKFKVQPIRAEENWAGSVVWFKIRTHNSIIVPQTLQETLYAMLQCQERHWVTEMSAIVLEAILLLLLLINRKLKGQ